MCTAEYTRRSTSPKSADIGVNQKGNMKIVIPLFLFIFFTSSSAYSNNKITLSSLVGPMSKISGMVLIEAYKQIGIEINIEEYPAERALQMANSNLVDGVVNRRKGIEKQYPHLRIVPIPINTIEGVAFTKNIDLPDMQWESLKPYSIVIRIGIKWAEQGTKGMKVSAFPTSEKMLQLIAYNRHDLCLTSRVNGLLTIKKLNLKGIKVLEPPLVKTELFHYLNEKNKTLLPKIRNSLLKMREEGKMAMIRKKYLDTILK